MKIAMILPSLANTGPGIVVQELCRGLVKRGHTCCVFYFDAVTELNFPCSTEQIGFWQSIDFSGWDVIHCHMLRPDLYVRLHFLKRKVRPLLISTLHNPVSYKALRTGFGRVNSVVGSLMWKVALTAFDRIVVLNSHTCATIRGVNRSKLCVIFNGRTISTSKDGCDEGDRICIEELRKKYTIVGTVSGITKRKGLEQMIQALTLLPDYAFVAVGDGPELENLKLQATHLKVAERCCWVGYKENATSYLPLFDVFVMCSHSEGFPLALVEAAGHALPTVLSDIPILQSVITDNEVAFYRLNDIDSLADAIRKVYADGCIYSKNIHDYYLDKLTADTMVENYLSII